jgi:hypothetical protein
MCYNPSFTVTNEREARSYWQCGLRDLLEGQISVMLKRDFL